MCIRDSTWPLWTGALTAAEIAPLLSENHEHLASTERHARGVDRLLRAPIRRADQGGYGSFGPTSPVPPV